MYASIPRNDSTVVYWGTFPEEDKMEYPAFDESKQTAYQGNLFISPDCTKAAFVFYYAIGFDVLDLSGHTVRHFIWKYPQVKIQYVDMLSVNLVKGADGWQRGFATPASRMSIFICCIIMLVPHMSWYMIGMESLSRRIRLKKRSLRYLWNQRGQSYIHCPPMKIPTAT